MRRSIRNRRSRRRINKEFDLQLTSMMDMLIILLVFLLKSYSDSTVSVVTSTSIRLPTSSIQANPADSTNLIVDPLSITVDGEKVIEFTLPATASLAADGKPTVTADEATYELRKDSLADSGRRIVPLYDALVKIREKSELLTSKVVWKDKDGKVVEPPKFSGALIIHADKAVRYDLLRKIMYTAGAAQFKTFKLITAKKDAG